MSRVPWYDDEAGFLAELARGRRAELQLAARLLPLGVAVRVGNREPRIDGEPFAKRRVRVADQIDLETGRLAPTHRIEVKARRFPFTSPEDYPYETAFVGSRKRWQLRSSPLCSVVLFSEPTGRYVVVPVATRPYWAVERSHDHRRGFVEESYAAPRWALRPEGDLLEHLGRACTEVV